MDINKFFEFLDLHNLNNYYLLSGDLNCRHTDWGNPIGNHKGNKLEEWLNDNDINLRCKLYVLVSPRSLDRNRI